MNLLNLQKLNIKPTKPPVCSWKLIITYIIYGAKDPSSLYHGIPWCKYIFLSDELTILPLLKLNHHKGSEEVKLSTRYSIFTLTWQNRKEETHKPLLVKEILTYLCTLTHLYLEPDYSQVNFSWKWIVRNKSSLVSWLLAVIHFVQDPAPCLRQ